MEELVHPLKHPIEIKAASGQVMETITELRLRRPKGKHLKATDAAKGEVGKTLALIVAIAGIPASAADEIDGEDLAAIGEVMGNFFGVSLTTGGT